VYDVNTKTGRSLFLRPACGLLLYLLGFLTRFAVAYQSCFRSSKLVVISTVFLVRVLMFQGVCEMIAKVHHEHQQLFAERLVRQH